MEYHRTKDIPHVKYVLGHVNIRSILVYTHLIGFDNDAFVSKIARNVGEACKLVEVGFEFVSNAPTICWCSGNVNEEVYAKVLGGDSNPLMFFLHFPS